MQDRCIPPRATLSRVAAKIVRPINAFFDYIYHSEYNPFYRSGTLAVGLLFVLLITGFYLLFFYSVSQPYLSVRGVQEQVWAGRWVRALHRYATDATLVAVIFHVIQLLAQGKTWGPRTLAWISGVILLIALFISTWTGYVMVWDQHGQLIALSGLEVLRSLPFLGDNLGQAFAGDKPLPASFFFMNLFLHIALPLGILFGMWIHTARLARTVWLPIKPVFFSSLVVLVLVSILIPATLLPEADLLQVIGKINADWWYGFWIPLIDLSSAGTVALLFSSTILMAFSIPFWWKPSGQANLAKSEVDLEACGGCTQCVSDCPYEAITMIPHPNGKHLLAEVSAEYCVSCGICAASCDDLAIGPPGRASQDHIAQMNAFCAENFGNESEGSVVVIACLHNDSVPDFLEKYSVDQPDVHYYPLNCCASLHSTALEKLLSHCGGVVLAGCASRNCMNRDALSVLEGRLYGKRVPFLAREIDRQRIVVSPHSETELDEIEADIKGLQSRLKGQVVSKNEQKSASSIKWFIKRSIATGVLVCLLAFLSQAPMGMDADFGLLRITSRVPSQTKLECRQVSTAELSLLPEHMRQKEICQKRLVSYVMRIYIDNQQALEEKFKAKGLRGELPIFIEKEIQVTPGSHQVTVDIIPEGIDSSSLEQLRQYKAVHDFKVGKIELVVL